MSNVARRALQWREAYGRGGTRVGVARARDIANRRNLSPQTVARMRSYFARHTVDKRAKGFRNGEKGFPSAGRIAWDLWGGDPGERWAKTMAKRKATPAQLRALAKGRAALKKSRGRKKNPLKAGYSRATVSANVSKLTREGMTPGRATAAALRSARQSYRARHPRGAFPSHIALTRNPRRRKNPGPPTRGAVMAKDLPGLTRGTTQRRATQQKVATKTLRRYPKPKGQGGFRTNPREYVLKNGSGYFNGAGFTRTKTGAAHYRTRKAAESIGRKIANATGNPVKLCEA